MGGDTGPMLDKAVGLLRAVSSVRHEQPGPDRVGAAFLDAVGNGTSEEGRIALVSCQAMLTNMLAQMVQAQVGVFLAEPDALAVAAAAAARGVPATAKDLGLDADSLLEGLAGAVQQHNTARNIARA